MHGIVEEEQSICPVQSAECDDDYWDSLLRSQLAELQIVHTYSGKTLESLRCRVFLHPICLLEQFPPCLSIVHSYRHSVVVNPTCSVPLVLAQTIHKCVKHYLKIDIIFVTICGCIRAASVNLNKRNQLSEDEPDVDHLDIGGGGQRLGHADEEGGQHQQRGQVHRHHRLEEEGLEEVGGVHYDEDEDCGEIGGENLIYNPSVHYNL